MPSARSLSDALSHLNVVFSLQPQRVVDCHLRNVYDFVHILQDTVLVMDSELVKARGVTGAAGAGMRVLYFAITLV